MSRDWRIALLVSWFVLLLFCVASFSAAHRPEPIDRTIAAPSAVAVVEPPPDPAPPAEPSRAVPTLGEAAADHIEMRASVLAGELASMWTRNPDQLVRVIQNASRQASDSPSITLLLAIAHAETNGKILDVSEAGAVGLAQATPVAARQEAFDGKLFVTRDYLIGSRAYIMKKPLGDADTIASLIVERDNERNRRKAKRLLASALALRLEGVHELDLLLPYATPSYTENIRRAKKHNLAVLRELERLLASGSRAEIRSFRDRVRREYRDLKRTQADSWRRYQLELAGRRDALLEEHFGRPASEVKRELPYEAAEFLGEALDERFSAQRMAEFLVRHLERKAEEARRLARKNDDVEEMTAALYNGGSHNVKRMLAGLIASLPETQRYMKKVPATRRRLDASIASLFMTPVDESAISR